MLWPSYKWRFCCSVTYIFEILPFMVCRSSLRGMKLRGLRVMLFPSFALGNASGEGDAPLASFSSFSVLFSLPLLSSPSPSFSFFFFHSSFFLFPFLPHKLLPSLSLILFFSISFLSFSFFCSFLSFSFLKFFFFF